MSERITTQASLYGICRLRARSPAPSARESAPNAADVLSFIFLLLFQCGSVIAIALNAPQVGDMGLVVFGIIFVWLGTTLIVGVCDLWARAQKPVSTMAQIGEQRYHGC
jgi:hypothetical protein